MTAARALRMVSGEMWWWLSGVCRLLGRYPVRALAWLAGAGWSVWESQWLGLVALVLPVVFFVSWARWWPVSYRVRVGQPSWRRRVGRRVRRGWEPMMETCGLSQKVPQTTRTLVSESGSTPADRVQVPRLRKLRWTADGQLSITPALLAGQTVGDVEAAAERLRTTMGATRLRVLPDLARTCCTVTARFDDPLSQMFTTPAPVQGCDPATLAGTLDEVTLGRTEDGQPWRIDLRVSTLTVGSSGAGKGSVMWSLILALAPAVRAGLVEVHGIDLKGGMELGLGRDLFTRYADTPHAAVQVLEEAVTQCEERARRMAGHTRLHTPTTSEPLALVLVDELASLVAYLPDRDLLRRAEQGLARLCSIGRAPGFFVYGFLQDPRKETLKARHLFGQTIALRLRDREEVAMVLGEGAIAAGAAAHHIPRGTPGIGYALDETGHIVRVRAGYVDDTAIRETARRFATPHVRPIETPAPQDPPPARPRATATSSGGRARPRTSRTETP